MQQVLNHPISKSLLEALTRQKYTLLGTVAICAVASMAGFRYVPKKYKIQAVINIQTQYFQNPLVRDFIPETFDGQELKAQRVALIRRALNHEYLRQLGAKYDLFGPKVKAEDVSSYDLEQLSQKFEIVPTGATSFLVSAFHKDPVQGYEILKDFLDHIRRTMLDDRRGNLLRLHGAIQDRLETLSFQRTGNAPLLASRPDLVRQEAARIEDEIKALRTSYSDKHPRIAELQKRLTELSKWMKPQAESGDDPGESSAPVVSHSANFSGAKVDPASKDLFQDLLRKYHYLEVVIDMDEQNKDAYLTMLQEPFVPRAAVWPKRPIFLVWGIAVGFLVGSIVALGAEVLRSQKWRARTGSRDKAQATA